MTLIVGIRCTDGAIVAADSAVTFGPSAQLPTISDTHCKIRIVKDRLIVAGTGQVGMGQRFAWRLEQLWADTALKGGDPIVMTSKIAAATVDDYAATRAPQAAYGALVAFPASKTKRAELCEFAVQDFQPELKTDQMWYASIGSGQLLADPYLRLMRHVFWQDGPPSLRSGKFAAMWVLMHAIKAAPGGIAEPIDMAVLEFVNGDARARMIAADELAEHRESVESSTKHFRDFERMILGQVTAPPAVPRLS
jgi:hypothetical protein